MVDGLEGWGGVVEGLEDAEGEGLMVDAEAVVDAETEGLVVEGGEVDG